MKSISLIICAFMMLFVTQGCNTNGKAKAKLPPATGKGAPPPPVMPKIVESTPSDQVNSNGSLVVTGTARPIHEAKVGPKGSGVISVMRVEEGDEVKKGQLLFRLESSNQNLAVSQAEAALSSALVAENATQTELQRIEALYKRGSVSPSTYDQVKAQYEGAQAAVKMARTSIARAKQAAVDTAVHAPFNGVIAQRMASRGETVTMMPPSVVLIIQDISQLELRARVPETMLSKLKPKSSVQVRFPAVDIERTVEIDRINPSVDPMSRTIEVVALVPNQDRALKAGMLVELVFDAEEETQQAETPAVPTEQPTQQKMAKK